MKYEETKKSTDGTMFKKKIVEVPEEFIATSKTQARKRINEEVFDLEDSVADNAKMISLILSLLYRLYNVMPESEKALLSLEDRGMIEGVFEQFQSIQTRADTQFAVEGFSMVTKILNRQGAIGNILTQG